MSRYDPWAGIEYTRVYRPEQRRPIRSAPPGLRVVGVVVPYGVKLRTNAGDTLLFDADTVWEGDSNWTPLWLEHSGLLGWGHTIELATGLVLDATVWGERTRAAGQRRELSGGFKNVETIRRADGVYHVYAATLKEASLVKRACWAPHTIAHVTPTLAA